MKHCTLCIHSDKIFSTSGSIFLKFSNYDIFLYLLLFVSSHLQFDEQKWGNNRVTMVSLYAVIFKLNMCKDIMKKNKAWIKVTDSKWVYGPITVSLICLSGNKANMKHGLVCSTKFKTLVIRELNTGESKRQQGQSINTFKDKLQIMWLTFFLV